MPVEPTSPGRRATRDLPVPVEQPRPGRRAAPQLPPAPADDFAQTSRRARRRAAEEAEPGPRRRSEAAPLPAGELPGAGRRSYSEPERPGEGRRRTYRDPGSDTGVRTWHIPDEPWRGTEVPWRGPDGEYHTGQIPAIVDDGEPGGPRRPDLTVIAGGAEVREYESDYEGRDVAPLRPDAVVDEQRSPGGEPGMPPRQPRSRHLKAVPGEPYPR